MVSIACVVPSPADAANISIETNTFSDDSTEFTIDFFSQPADTRHGISIQSGLWIDSASMKVSTVGLYGGRTDAGRNLTLDIGNDGTYEWMFKGPAYGGFGHQTYFSNDKETMSVLFPSKGGANNTTYIRLPYGAQVKSATMNISNAGGMGGGKILLAVAVSDNYAQDIRNKLRTFPDSQEVDYVLTQYSTISLETMKLYSSILVSSDYSISDTINFGNKLADYVDGGGGVVSSIFCTQGTSMGPQGRFESGGYYIMPHNSGASYSAGSMGSILVSGHPIMMNVNTFSTNSYRSNTATVTPGSIRVAQYTDGYTLVATKDINGIQRVDLGFYPPSSDVLGSWNSGTDGKHLIHNALAFAGRKALTNVTLDILNDSQVEWSNETFNTTQAVPDFTTMLNGYLATAAPSGSDPFGNQYVDVPLNLTAGTGGSVMLQNLSIDYDYSTTIDSFPGGNLSASINDMMPIKVSTNNFTIPLKFTSDSKGRMRIHSLSIVSHPPNHKPTVRSFEPESPLVLNEMEEQSFLVNAVDVYGNPLSYIWQYDDVEVIGETTNGYTLKTGYNSSGKHTVTAVVMNGLDWISQKWDITVLNVNREPVIDSFIPTDSPVMSENQTMLFRVNASDPDNDPLTYSWAIDGVPIPKANSSSMMYTSDFSNSGEWAITATVKDSGNLTAVKNWMLTIENTNVAPNIVDYMPKVNPKIKELESVRFSVVGADADNQSVSASWYVDGVQVFVGTTYTFKTDYTSAGKHEIKVVVSDGNLDSAHIWTVMVENVNRLPNPVVDSPTAPEYMLGDIIKFSAKSSKDVDMDPLNFTWKEDTVVISTQMEFERTFSPGIHTIMLYVVDSYGGVNSTTVRFRVRSVEIAGIIGLDKLDLTPGDKVNIIATLSNIGDAPASNVKVEVLVDGTSLGSKTLAQLNAGAAYRETFGWKAGKVGNHTVVLKVGEQSWQRTIYVDAKATTTTTESAAGANEVIGISLIIVVMVVLLAFGFMMMRRK